MSDLSFGTDRMANMDSLVYITHDVMHEPPQLATLWCALENLAAGRGGRITPQINDIYGRNIPCAVGVRTRDLPCGLGLWIRPDGKLTFLYDARGDLCCLAPGLAAEICAGYNQTAGK
jgi:hypothetical protein